MFACLGDCDRCCCEHGGVYLFILWFCLGISPGVGLLDHVATLFLVISGTSILFSTVAASVYIPTNSSLLSTPSPAFVICRLFSDGHSNQCEVPRCCFDSSHKYFFNISYVSGLGQAWGMPRGGETGSPCHQGVCSPGGMGGTLNEE